MQSLENEIQAFNAQKEELVKHYNGKFVIFSNEKLEGSFDTFDAAAKEAVKKFGDSIFLIRQVGKDSSLPLPASVAFKVQHASY